MPIDVNGIAALATSGLVGAVGYAAKRWLAGREAEAKNFRDEIRSSIGRFEVGFGQVQIDLAGLSALKPQIEGLADRIGRIEDHLMNGRKP